MDGLERFRGHFYNWYDTHDLRPLDPKYISSVDSGNLSGTSHCRWQCMQRNEQTPCSKSEWTAGISDALMLTRERLRTLRMRGNPNV